MHCFDGAGFEEPMQSFLEDGPIDFLNMMDTPFYKMPDLQRPTRRKRNQHPWSVIESYRMSDTSSDV